MDNSGHMSVDLLRYSYMAFWSETQLGCYFTKQYTKKIHSKNSRVRFDSEKVPDLFLGQTGMNPGQIDPES